MMENGDTQTLPIDNDDLAPEIPSVNGAGEKAMSVAEWTVLQDHQAGRFIESKEMVTVGADPLSYMPKTRIYDLDEINDLVDIVATQNQLLDSYTNMPECVMWRYVSVIAYKSGGRNDFKEVAIAERNRGFRERFNDKNPFARANDIEGNDVQAR